MYRVPLFYTNTKLQKKRPQIEPGLKQQSQMKTKCNQNLQCHFLFAGEQISNWRGKRRVNVSHLADAEMFFKKKV